MHKKIRGGDRAVMLAVAAAGIFFICTARNKIGSTAHVSAAGTEYEFSLTENTVRSVAGAAGDTVFEIQNGKIRIIDSVCNDKRCVRAGFSTLLVCLPNKVIIKTDDGAGFDALSE